jgi:peptide/nickel transport system substrate-binding protein
MLKHRSFWSAVAGIGVVLTMLLSACGGTSSGGGNTANQPKAGGSLVDGISQEPSSLMTAQSTQAFAAIADATIWAPLMYVDNQAQFHAGLLTQVPSSTNGGITLGTNTQTITLKLRPNLKWSDGQPLTSADVAFAIKTYSDKSYGDKQGFQASEITSVSTPDAQTTVITLNTIDVTFLVTSLTDVLVFTPLPQHHYSSMTPAQIAADFQPAVTSGPFTLVERVKGDHITVKKNPNYYQAPKPYLDQITFKYFPDAQTIVTALQAGQVTNAYFLPVDAKSTLQSIPGYSLYQPASGASYEALYFNLSNPILQDVQVREALAIGFDTKTEISQIQKGNAAPTCDDGTGTFAHDTSLVKNGYCPVGPDQFAGYDPAKANQLLDAAGWTGPKTADGYRTKNGQTLALRASTTSGRQYRLDSQQLYQAAWKNLGVKLTIVNHPSSDLFGPVLFPSDQKYAKSNDQWDVAELANSLSVPDSHLIWSSDQFPPAGGQNLTYYTNSTVDQLEKQQATQFDQTQRKATLKQIYVQILKDAPTVYLYSAFDLSEYKSNLHNYMPSAVGGVEAWNVWDWWLS